MNTDGLPRATHRAAILLLLATVSCTSQEELAEIAKTSHGATADKAVGKLADQTLLVDVATHASDRAIRLAASRRLTNPVQLDAIAASDLGPTARSLDPTLVVTIDGKPFDANRRLRPGGHVIVAELREDTPLWKRRSRRSHSASVEAAPGDVCLVWNDVPALTFAVWGLRARCEPIASLPTLLSTLPSAQTRARLVAIPEFSSQDVLVDLARTAPDWQVRAKAAQKVEDQALLASIAKTDAHEWVRTSAAAYAKARASRNLVALAKGHDVQARFAAVSLLSDQAQLIALAETAPDPDIRMAALNKVEDPKALARIARTANDWQQREAALQHLTDDALLFKIAKADTDFRVRAAAVERLSDQKALADVAKTDEEFLVRIDAVMRLTDQTALTDIARHDRERDVDGDWPVRKAAKERLKALRGE